MIDVPTITAVKWRRIDDGLGQAVSSLIVVWLCSCGLLSDATNSWLPGIALIPLLLIAVGLAYRWFRRRVAWQYKVFFVPFTEATQVLGNVLRTKGIPFRQVDELSGVRAVATFELEGGDLVVKVGGRHDSAQRLAHVEIRPASRDSRLLAQSLQAKIDEAFAPQGLSR